MSLGAIVWLAALCISAFVGFGTASALAAALGQVSFFICFVTFMVTLVLQATARRAG